ncbi:MAG: glycosyltransferase [Casimicrobiaceae bacterium]|nr:glycosyltransferase [Casimicrobiaceae bacterium]
MIEHSLGVVVHSRFAAEILQAAYPSLGCEVVVSPHLRKLPPASHLASKKEARNLLGLGAEEFVVCSFGLVTPHKLPERVLEAWKLSALSRSQRAQLVFVGDCPATDWGRQFRLTLAEYSRFRARSTGRTTVEQYNLWLRAADVAIQLRHDSRGETSGAALDALAHGLPLIVNEHGSSSELPADVVIRVSEDADPTQLANALDRLASDATLRSTLSARARNHIQEEHDPARCAERMYFSIERFYAAPTSAAYAAITYWAGAADHITQSDQEKFADSLAFSHPARHHRPQLLLDVSELVQRDLKSGIQRVTRLLATYLLRNPPSGFDVHLVYATQETTGYRYAKNFTQTLLKTDFGPMLDDPVEVQPNDCFIALDLQPEILPVQAPLLRRWRTYGVRTYVFVYDLLPLLFPSYFPEGMHPRFLQWLQTLNCFDGAICISRSVADDVGRWMLANFPAHRRMPFSLHWIHLGADFLTDDATSGLPVGNGRDRAAIRTKPCFLMVGTIEPRKGHALVLAAFERLWRAGYDFGLVVAGRPGWCTESLLHRLRNHPRRHKNLFLLESPSDRLLDELYSDCFCLIAASEGEGFGLPLVEAARKGLPLLARDIPVFREVVGNHGRYFSENATPRELARCLRDAHRDITQKNYPSSCGVTTRTWSDVAASVTKIVLGAQPPYRLVTPGVRQWVYFGNDPRLHSHVGERRGWSMLSRREAGFLIFGPFLSLAAGTYRVRFRGSCVATVGSELFEVVENPSSPALAALIVPGGLRDAYSIAFEFQLENDSPSLEFRVWVDAQSELSVEEISVQAIN